MSHEIIQKKLLEKITNSSEFVASKVYASYLSYLIEATNQGRPLKEVTIAIEFFGKDSTFNPAEDTIVRAHTYTLRKKLENYYLNEGKDDEYRLRIPKGHYEAKFVQRTDELYHPKKLFQWLKKRYYLIIIGLLIGLAAILWFENQANLKQLQEYQFVQPKDPIWKDYLRSQLPILIVVGDHFFFDEYNPKYNQVVSVRDGKINSIEDLEELKARYPDDSVKPTDEPYFPYHSIWSLPPILNMLFAVDQKPLMRKSSSISPQILGEYNIIFVGSIKTLYILKHTLSNTHFSFEILPHKITYTPPDSSAPLVFRTSLHSAGPNEDLVLALKLPGPMDNSIFIIASYHSLGAPEVVTYLTQASTRFSVEQKFIERYGEMPRFFEILFRVTGIDKTAYSTDMLVFNAIEKK
jgi:hypothetical protein